jgi:hypothetical protein
LNDLGQAEFAEVLNSAQRLTFPTAVNLWASSLDINTMHEFHICVVEDMRRVSDQLTLYGLRTTRVGIMFAVSGTTRMLAKPAASS